jgi:hypothetical protein
MSYNAQKQMRVLPSTVHSTQNQSTATAFAPITVSSSFLDIPAELHYLIISRYLLWHSILTLRQTCKYFSTLLEPRTILQMRQRIIRRLLQDEERAKQIWRATMWQIGSFPGYVGHLLRLNCYLCLTQMQAFEFLVTEIVGSFDVTSSSATKRCCKTCQLRHGRVLYGSWSQDTTRKCALCGDKYPVTWWGCVGCFQKLERRRQIEDREAVSLGSAIVRAAGEKWQSARAAWKRWRMTRQQPGRVRWYPCSRAKLRLPQTDDTVESEGQPNHLSSAAADLAQKSREKRWQSRCLQCWEPNCRFQPWRLSMLEEIPLEKARWCEGCIADEAYFVELRKSKDKVQREQATYNLSD